MTFWYCMYASILLSITLRKNRESASIGPSIEDFALEEIPLDAHLYTHSEIYKRPRSVRPVIKVSCISKKRVYRGIGYFTIQSPCNSYFSFEAFVSEQFM